MTVARRQLSVQLDEKLIETIDRAAARDHVGRDSVVEESLRRYFGLRGLAVLADIRQSRRERRIAPPRDEELLVQAVTEVRAHRAERRSASAEAGA